MSDLIHKIIFTCQQANTAIEQKEDERLGFFGNLRLNLHLFICHTCRKYAQQSQHIGKLLEKRFSLPSEPNISDDTHIALREKILNRLKENPTDKDD